MDLLLLTIVLMMAVERSLCQVFDESMPRTGNVGVAPGQRPPDGMTYGIFTTPAPRPGQNKKQNKNQNQNQNQNQIQNLNQNQNQNQNIRWQYSPDDNSIVEGSVYVDDTPKATGKYEIEHPNPQIRSQVNYVADENGYRASFMLRRA